MLSTLLWNLLLTAALATALVSFCRIPWLARRPALRCWLWLFLIVKLITPPLINLPILPALAGEKITTENKALTDVTEEKTSDFGKFPVKNPSFHATLTSTDRGVDHAVSEGSRSKTAPSPNAILTSTERDVSHAVFPGSYSKKEILLGALIAISLFGSCVFLAVHGGRSLKLYRCLRRLGTENALLAEACYKAAASLNIGGIVRSRVVDARMTPLLLGWGSPLVVMPRELLDELSPQQLRGIVAHELAHFARRDHWTNIFAFLVKTALWWNPVAWWAEHELHAAQELCCDAMAIDRGPTDRRGYADALLMTLDFIQSASLHSYAIAAGLGTKRTLLRRFEMIGEKQLSYRLSRGTFAALLILSISLVCMPVRGQAKVPSAPVAQTDDAAALAGNSKNSDKKGETSKPNETKNVEGKDRRMHLDLQEISRAILEYQQSKAQYPKTLSDLYKHLPKDVYSPTGEDYRYELHPSRFILSSYGKDGIYGNDDDEVLVAYKDRQIIGQRREIYPLPEEKKEQAPEKEVVSGVRPQGNCSISGKVVLESNGEPIERGRMYLHYNVTHGSKFVYTDKDGDFEFKDIPQGPFSLQLSLSPGYQDVSYNPDDKTGRFPLFSLRAGEHRTGIVLKAKQACRISGKISDEGGKVPKNLNHLTVLAWVKNEKNVYHSRHGNVNEKDGTYSIDGLDGKPVYVMAINWRAAKEGDAYPPIYYPGTFSRNEAKQVTFDQKTMAADGIDLTLRREGGFVIEGTVSDEAGMPVPEAFVVVHRQDMLFDFVTAYTDKAGRYRIQGLAEGEFLLHVDAVHRGFVRMRTPINLDKDGEKTRRDITLAQGVLVSGKITDENGKPWQIGDSTGFAITAGEPRNKGPENVANGFSLTNFRNKYRPQDSLAYPAGHFRGGEGNYYTGEMIFPTSDTFVIQGLTPGRTRFTFLPNKEGEKVAKILLDDKDILESGVATKPGQEIKDVTIVIGKQ